MRVDLVTENRCGNQEIQQPVASENHSDPSANAHAVIGNPNSAHRFPHGFAAKHEKKLKNEKRERAPDRREAGRENEHEREVPDGTVLENDPLLESDRTDVVDPSEWEEGLEEAVEVAECVQSSVGGAETGPEEEGDEEALVAESDAAA